VGKTAYADAPAHLQPAQTVDQFGQYLLQRDAMQRIVDLWSSHLRDAGIAGQRNIDPSLPEARQARMVSGMTILSNKVKIGVAAFT